MGIPDDTDPANRPRDYDADISQEDRSNYVFNLDGSVNEAEQLFSVDAKMHGMYVCATTHNLCLH